MGNRAMGERLHNAAESQNLSMSENFKRENREILLASTLHSDMFTAEWNGQKTFQTVPLT